MNLEREIVITERDLENKEGSKIKAGHPCLVLRRDPPYVNIYELYPRPTAGLRVAGVNLSRLGN